MRAVTRGVSLTTMAVVGLVVLSAGVAAKADLVIDGNLSDWGVQPFTNWTPNTGTAYVVTGWPGGNFPYGGEQFVTQAMYTMSDATHLDVGIVTNFPETGVADPYNSSLLIQPGDLLLHVNPADGQQWDYAITLNGPNKGDIYFLPTLTLPQGNVGIPANGPSNVDITRSGSPVGKALVAWHNYGDLEGFGAPTYGIEISANWVDLGNPQDPFGLMLHNTMGCGNDALDLADSAAGLHPNLGDPVPEPATCALLVIGGLMLGGRALVGRRRVKV